MSDLRNLSGASLGIRQNNPGNLRPGIKWNGAIGSNKGFIIFSSVEYGIRAMAMDIKNDIVKDKKDTLTKYITEYAPPSENDTSAYINRVSRDTGFNPNEKLIATPETMFKLVKAHIAVENGKDAKYITDKMIRDGIALMSGGSLPPIAKTSISIFILILIGAGIYFYTIK